MHVPPVPAESHLKNFHAELEQQDMAQDPEASDLTRQPKTSLKRQLRYRFDNALSRGPSVVFAWLGLVTFGIAVISTAAVMGTHMAGVNGKDSLSLGDAFWESIMRALGRGGVGSDKGWIARGYGLVMLTLGLMIGGTLIGLISTAFRERILLLRKGRSFVIEEDHTVILGWSSRVASIISELIIANESRSRTAVVVLAEADKTAMEDSLRDRISDFRTTRVVCRSGNISSPDDLKLANINAARSIIVVGSDDNAVVKSLLAIHSTGASAPVVAEVNGAETARTVRELFDGNVAIVSAATVVGDLAAQACRQRGLSQVFRELLDFDGDELYIAPFPELTGRTYADTVLAFEKSTPIGLLGGDGRVVLNPAPSTVLAPSDQVIAIAADDSEYVYTGVKPPARRLEPRKTAPSTAVRRTIIAGWSHLGPRVIAELDKFARSRTLIEVLLDPTRIDIDAVKASVAAQHVKLKFTPCSSAPEELARYASRHVFHDVIVLGQREVGSTESADAQTLLTLLAFNRLVKRKNLQDVRVVAELLEIRHTPLAEATGADDFVVSDELGSLMIAQISERHELEQVFERLFDHAGENIELAPVARYGATEASCFADIVAVASAIGHTAIGYRSAEDRQVRLNPAKSAPLTLTAADEVVVLRSAPRPTMVRQNLDRAQSRTHLDDELAAEIAQFPQVSSPIAAQS